MVTLEDERRPLLEGVSNKAVTEYIVLDSLTLGDMKESNNGGADDQIYLWLNN